MAAWSNAAAAPARRAPARTRTQPAARPPRARRAPQARRVTGAIVWIGSVAVLLAGVVALNVAVLRLNMRADRLDRERADLRAANAALQSQIASAAAVFRLQNKATRLGLRPAPPEDTTYLQLTGR